MFFLFFWGGTPLDFDFRFHFLADTYSQCAGGMSYSSHERQGEEGSGEGSCFLPVGVPHSLQSFSRRLGDFWTTFHLRIGVRDRRI